MSIIYIFLLLVYSSLANNIHRKISNILLINEQVTFCKHLKQNFLKSTWLERCVLLEVQMVRYNKRTHRQLHLFQFCRVCGNIGVILLPLAVLIFFLPLLSVDLDPFFAIRCVHYSLFKNSTFKCWSHF